MDISAVSKSPLAAFSTVGALTLVILKTIADDDSLLNACTIKSSMPFKLPWLSNIGTHKIIRRFTLGEITDWLLLLVSK